MISIITASYNSAATIEDTLKSVLAQTTEDYEYIIIDGNSSDKTVSIIERYAPSFQGKLTYISEPDKGIYDAWNKGIKLAKGEWICFIGSDDILLKDSLKNYMKAISNADKSINFISSKVELVTNKLEHINIIGKPWSSAMKNYCSISHVGALHHCSLYEINGLYSLKYKICSDYEFLFRNYHYIIPAFMNEVKAKMRNEVIRKKMLLNF